MTKVHWDDDKWRRNFAALHYWISRKVRGRKSWKARGKFSQRRTGPLICGILAFFADAKRLALGFDLVAADVTIVWGTIFI